MHPMGGPGGRDRDGPDFRLHSSDWDPPEFPPGRHSFGDRRGWIDDEWDSDEWDSGSWQHRQAREHIDWAKFCDGDPDPGDPVVTPPGTPDPVPEPASLTFLAVGLAGCVLTRRIGRRRQDRLGR